MLYLPKLFFVLSSRVVCNYLYSSRQVLIRQRVGSLTVLIVFWRRQRVWVDLCLQASLRHTLCHSNHNKESGTHCPLDGVSLGQTSTHLGHVHWLVQTDILSSRQSDRPPETTLTVLIEKQQSTHSLDGKDVSECRGLCVCEFQVFEDGFKAHASTCTHANEMVHR
jgi:hypothetical protein